MNFKQKWHELRRLYGKERVFDIRFDNNLPCEFENVEFNLVGFADYTLKQIYTFQVVRYYWESNQRYNYFLSYKSYFRMSNGKYAKTRFSKEDAFEVTEQDYLNYLKTVSEIPSNKHVQVNF